PAVIREIPIAIDAMPGAPGCPIPETLLVFEDHRRLKPATIRTGDRVLVVIKHTFHDGGRAVHGTSLGLLLSDGVGGCSRSDAASHHFVYKPAAALFALDRLHDGVGQHAA